MFRGRQCGAVNYSVSLPQSEEEEEGKSTCVELCEEACGVCCKSKASMSHLVIFWHSAVELGFWDYSNQLLITHYFLKRK